MIGRMSLSAAFLTLGLFCASFALSAQERPTFGVPKGDGKPILTDGIFSPGEWDDALRISIRPNVELLVKKSGGFVYLGFRRSQSSFFVIDLFISPDGRAIRQLHASAQLGERLLNDVPGTDDDPEFTWGDTADWYANEVRWNAGKAQALMKEGKSRDDAIAASLYKYDGFEFAIRQSKFGTGEWLIRLESAASPDWTKPLVFPEGTDAASTRGWLKLVF